MIIQKLYRNGNSVSVTVPKEYLKALRLRDGSRVQLELYSDNDGIFIRKPTKKSGVPPSSLTPEFKEWLDEVSSKYKRVIKELAKR